ncbi:MAG: hypothetical protein WBY44_37360 [Bryobacteraceae bacterium]
MTTTLEQIETNLLRNGRGTQAASEGIRLVKAKQSIGTGGDPAVVLASFEDSPYLKPPTTPSTLAVLTENPSSPNVAAGRVSLLNIPIRNGPASPSMPVNRGVAEFEDLFPRTTQPHDAWTRSYRGVIEDLQRAPGGIIIDAKLPAFLAARIQRARFHPASGALTLEIDGRSRKIEPAVDPEVIRIAYAFVKDGRVMPMDLRNINSTETYTGELLLGSLVGPVFLQRQRLTPSLLRPQFLCVNLFPRQDRDGKKFRFGVA